MGSLGDARAAVSALEERRAAASTAVRAGVARAGGAIEALRRHEEGATSRAAEDARARVGTSVELYGGWDDPAWQGWECRPRLPEEVRVGWIGNGIDLPATVPLFDGRTVVLGGESSAAADAASKVLRSMATRLAAAMGDRVVLHLIDPHQGGYGFDERTVLPQDVPRSADVADDLEVVIQAAYAFQTRHDAVPFHQLPDDVRRAEAAHVVLAMDYPRGYDHRAVHQLNEIARLGKAGVQLVVHHDLTADEPGEGLRLQWPHVVQVGSDGTLSGPWGGLRARADGPPPAGLLATLGAAFRRTTPDVATNDQLSWGDVGSVDPVTWWNESPAHEARAVIGREVDGSPLEVWLGQGEKQKSRSHVAIGGNTGSGKGGLLHALILGLATRYSPADLRFYLLDGQNGVTMQSYADLPHADLVSIRTPIDLARQVIADLHSEQLRRDVLLTEANVDNIASYRARTGDDQMPRLVVVIDEYQAFLAGDKEDATISALTAIAAQGRKVGMHLVLASQRFHADGVVNQGKLFDQIHTRISLMLANDAIDRIDEFDREGRALIRSHCTEIGRVVMTRDSGAPGSNRCGSVAYADDDTRAALVAALAEKARAEGVGGFGAELFDARRPADPSLNRALTALADVDAADPVALERWAESDTRSGGLGVTGWHPYDQPLAFVAGRSFSIYGSSAAKLDRSPDHNVMVVGGDPEVVTGIVASGVVSASMSTAPGRLRVLVLNELPPPGPWEGLLARDLASLLALREHTVDAATDPAGAAELLAEAVEEVRRRAGLGGSDLAARGPLLVVGVALDRLPAFRNTEGRFGPEPSEQGAALQAVLSEGPAVGVHAVVGATSRVQWSQVMPEKTYRRFVHRFYQQMGEADSRLLIDSNAANDVTPPGTGGQPRAAYGNRDTNERHLLLPYGPGIDLVAALRPHVERSRGAGT